MSETRTRRRAASTRLEPGEHSIDRNTPTKRVLSGQSVYALDWSIRLHDGRLKEKIRTQGKSPSEVKRRAKQRAAAMLANGGQASQWTGTSSVERYLDEVAAKEIEDSGLREASLRQYRRVLGLLRAELKGHSVASAWQYDVLVEALERIAASNGAEAARQTRTVAGRYVAQPMMRHRLIDRDPLAGVRLNLKKHAKQPDQSTPKRGGRGLTAEEQEKVIQHLLALDPAEGAVKPKRGRWTLEHVIAKRRNVIDLTLLQAAAAPRISEALQLTADLLAVDGDGEVEVVIPAEVAKTGVGRRTPVTDKRLAARLIARREEALEHGGYLIGRPSDPSKRWPSSGNGGAAPLVAELYRSMAQELGIPLLEHARSHMWRTTLTSRYTEAGVEREDVAAMLGHDEQTNLRSYTDRTDLSAAREAYRRKHGELKPTV